MYNILYIVCVESDATGNKTPILENLTMKMPRIYYGILAVFCVVTIGIGMASAVDLMQSFGHTTHEKGWMHPGFDLTNATMQQQMISRFEQQGTDVSELKAAFESGNMTDVKTWLDANRPAHPGRQPEHAQQEKTSSL
jgi:hypothetical protein